MPQLSHQADATAASMTTVSVPSPLSRPFIGKGKTLKDELTIRSIKIIDICFISTIYLTIGFVVGKWINKQYGTFDKEYYKNHSILELYASIVFHFCLIGVTTYIVRNLVERIPFPLNGVHGYNHFLLKELGGAAFFTYMLFTYQDHLKAKIAYLSERINL